MHSPPATGPAAKPLGRPPAARRFPESLPRPAPPGPSAPSPFWARGCGRDYRPPQAPQGQPPPAQTHLARLPQKPALKDDTLVNIWSAPPELKATAVLTDLRWSKFEAPYFLPLRKSEAP